MNQEPTENSLEWLAFCYVADELSADERAAFEERLATDQAAREAVAAAVELSLATQWVVAEAEQPVVTKSQPTADTYRRGWWSVALACGGLLALVVMNQLVWRPGTSPEAARELALAWSATLPDDGSSESEDANVNETLLMEPLGEEVEMDLPTWMVAAVSESTMNMTENPPADTIPE